MLPDCTRYLYACGEPVESNGPHVIAEYVENPAPDGTAIRPRSVDAAPDEAKAGSSTRLKESRVCDNPAALGADGLRKYIYGPGIDEPARRKAGKPVCML